MRPDLSAPDLALLESGTYDLHWKVEVANGDGTLIDLSGRLKAVQWSPPSPDAPIATLRAAFIRELNDDPTTSLSPTMAASLLNRLDDGTTYAPLLKVGRDFVASVAPTAIGAARPSSGFYEVLRGKVGANGWPGRYGDAAITARDDSGRLEKEWIREPLTFEAGTLIEDVIQTILDGSGGTYTLTVPVATGAGLSEDYSTGKQSRWAAIWAVAQSRGWVIWQRYQADGSADLTLFEPERSKTTADFVAPKVRDYTALEVNEDDIRNVWEVEYSDEDGARLSVTVEDPGSIAEYGGIERFSGIAEPPSSPVRTSDDALALANAALSDSRDPDAVATAVQPLAFHLECAVDLVTYPADDVFFDADQDLAPFSLTHSHEAGKEHQTSANVRGKPSGGRAAWRGRSARYENPTAEYGLIDFREVAPGTAGNRRWAWTRRGRQVAEVWFAFEVYAAPWDEDYFGQVKQRIAPIPDDQDYVEIPNANLPDASQVGALWVEPRIARGSGLGVYNDAVIERVKVQPVAADLDVDLSAEIVSNAVDLSLTLTQAAGAKVYPATALIYEDGENGTLIATIPFAGDGTKTKADRTALGARSLPAEGKRTWVAVVTDVAGNVYRDQAETPAPRGPFFDHVKQQLDVSLISIDFFGRVSDPAGLGGTLEVWVPADGTTPADPEAAPTASLVIAATDMPFSFGPASVAALDAVPSAPGTSLDVVLKFTATDGRTTGQQFFALQDSMQVLVDALGQLRAESVYNGLVLAPQYRPYYLGSGAPSLTPEEYGTDRYFDTAARQPYSHNGSAWAVDNSTPAVSYAPILRAGVVTAEVADITSLRSAFVGAERLTADNLSIGGLSFTGNDIGAITKGALINAAADAGLDLDATGTDPVLWAPGISIAADGSLSVFDGTVASTRFTGASLDLDGSIGFGTVNPLGSGATRALRWESYLATAAVISSDGIDITLAVSASGDINLNGDTAVGGDLDVSGTIYGNLDAGVGGTVTAGTFVGSLSGNASTATAATNATQWGGNPLAGTTTITDKGGTDRTVPYI